MRKILIGLLVVGICGIVNSSPIPDNTTPTFQTVSSSTEKNINEPHSTSTEKKETAPTTASTTTKLPDNSKLVTENHSGKGLTGPVTTANKNEASTVQSHKDEPTVTPSSNKVEVKDSSTSSLGLKGGPIATPPSKNKQEEKETGTTPAGHKIEPTSPLVTDQKGPTTIKPSNGDKENKPNNNQKPTKTSTAYLDKGKVVIFNGICGPEGCEIEGDIYDELEPLPHSKKQG